MFRDRFLIGAASAVVLSLGAVGYLYFTQTKKTAELEARRDLSVSDSTRYANFLKDFEKTVLKNYPNSDLGWLHLVPNITDNITAHWSGYLLVIIYAGSQVASTYFMSTTMDKTSGLGLPRPQKAAPASRPEAARDGRSARSDRRSRLRPPVDIQALTRFAKDLERRRSHERPARQVRARARDEQVTQFQLTIGYNRPDSTAIRRAPLTLSVR
jgi:hypothetical protein